MTDRKDIPTIRSVKKEVDGLTQDINQIKDEIPQVEVRLKEVISAKINAGTISTCDVMDKIKTSSESLKDEFSAETELIKKRLLASEEANKLLKMKLDEATTNMKSTQDSLGAKIEAQQGKMLQLKAQMYKERTFLAVISGLAIGLALVTAAVLFAVL